MSLYYELVPPFANMLTNAEGWIDAAAEHAQRRSFELDTLLQARLAPDQYPLVRQFQSMCDAAKFGCARATGKEPPKHPDTEQSFDEVRARLRTVREYVAGFAERDFADSEERLVQLPMFAGKAMRAADYVRELAIPNFYFHSSHAYAILRHNGVELGKRHFIGRLTLREV